MRTGTRHQSFGVAKTMMSDIFGTLMPLVVTAAFAATFGAPIEQLDRLLEAKTLSIARLMEIAPEGAVDPTPSLYNTTMYAMAALLVVAFFANLLMRPVSERHHYRG